MDQVDCFQPRFWLVGWLISKEGYPSLEIKFLDFQNLIGASRISPAPPAT